MLAIIPVRRTTVLRTRWTEAVTQMRKGMQRLGKGFQRFASRHPTAGMLGAGALLGAAYVLLFTPRVVSARAGRHAARE
jgi:hypothetical protein